MSDIGSTAHAAGNRPWMPGIQPGGCNAAEIRVVGQERQCKRLYCGTSGCLGPLLPQLLRSLLSGRPAPCVCVFNAVAGFWDAFQMKCQLNLT